MSGDERPESRARDSAYPPEGRPTVPPEEADARLAEVTAFLASAPAPVLPDAVEARISAALAAEAAARAGDSGRTDATAPAGDTRTLGPAPVRARVGRHRSGGGHRALRSRPLMATAAAIVCLALAGLGYGLSGGHGSPAASSASSATGAVQPGNEAAGPAAPAPEPTSSSTGSPSAVGLSFAVTESGTRYEAATLATQARARAAGTPEAATAPGPGRTNQAAGAASSAPTAGLRGCVARLTDGRSPRLVDRATYQGKPAYIIVGSTKVWVVGRGCTAGNQELIASVPLEP